VADRATFAPRSVEARDARDGSFRHTVFEGTRVSITCGGHLCPANMTSRSATDTGSRADSLAVAPFDYFNGSYGMLFAVLTLHEGDHLALPVYHPLRGLFWLSVDVGQREEVRVGARSYAVWEVRTPQTGFVYKISNAPPYWIRLDVRMPDGSRQRYERPQEPSRK
jgi:hypothetical protein